MNPAETYIIKQEEPFKAILLQLQVLIENTIPEVELMYKYKIPFYYLKGKPFCYLNVTKGYVDVGFWNAAHLTRHLEHMITDGRKVMKSLRYYLPKDIDECILIEVLQDAYSVKDKKFFNHNT